MQDMENIRDIEDDELGFQEWLFKLSERLQIMTISIRDSQLITVDDEEGVLRPLHTLWHTGGIIFPKIKSHIEATNCRQGGLFDDRMTDNP